MHEVIRTASRTYHIGFYEFADKAATKVLRFSLIPVKETAGWQTFTHKVKLLPGTKEVRFYAAGRGVGTGESLLIKDIKVNVLNK